MEGTNGAFIAGMITAIAVPFVVSAVYNRAKHKLPLWSVNTVDFFCDVRDRIKGKLGV